MSEIKELRRCLDCDTLITADVDLCDECADIVESELVLYDLSVAINRLGGIRAKNLQKHVDLITNQLFKLEAISSRLK